MYSMWVSVCFVGRTENQVHQVKHGNASFASCVNEAVALSEARPQMIWELSKWFET